MKPVKLLLCIAAFILGMISCQEEEQPPVVSCVFTDVTVDAQETSAVIKCLNESVDDDKVHGSVLLSLNENITDATKYPLRLKNDTLCSTINGLERNTMYYFCFEVSTANEHQQSNEIHHFQTTGGGSVIVTTSEAINVTQTTATGGGNVSGDENNIVTLRGVCWDTIANPNAVQSPHLVSGEGMGTFLLNITGLKSGKKYYMKAYAVCNDVMYYGNQVEFTTQSAQAPTVTTGEVSNIAQTSAQCGGNVMNDGGATVTERGICWGTTHNPTTSGSHAGSGTGMGSFTVNMTGLTGNTTYYVRAYAKNCQGTSYGDEVSFSTTLNTSSPSVTTSQVTDIAQTTAKGGGNVTSDGGATVTERGICWSTSHNPTMTGSHASSGTGTGSFTANMTGLTGNTTYYVRAYAKNSVGVAYGNEVSFVTVASLPTVTTSQVTNIAQTSAKGGGNVTSDGGATVTERGICWSTTHNPTTSHSHANSGTGTGSFTVNMTGLTSNTTYYVRAYAKNSKGTSYGTEVSFKTTQNTSSPTVTTSQVTNITQTTAKGGGNVTASGGANVTARGICWSTSHNPTVSGSHASSGTGTGTFTANMTGLTANTTYYVRAYATNSAGTSYGSEVSFVTSAVKPTVTTSQVTNVTQTTAKGGGNVTNSGGANVTTRGICWSTSHDPTTSGSHASSGSGTGTFTATMTGLSANTTYFVRAYATNSAGTSYGSEVSFTTEQIVSVPTVLTTAATNVAQNSATCGGNVTNNGGASVTERGVCWSTSQNPTTSGNHLTSGTGTGTFSVNLTGLSAGTTYHFRAYAKNSQGTSYGSDLTFTTTSASGVDNLSEGFENGIPSSWATIDADGDGNCWERSSELMAGYNITPHTGVDMVSSASYINNVGPLTPDNYLVTPAVTLGATFSFWACAQDAAYAAEHFGIAVSTGSQTNASSFTTIQEWTLTAKTHGNGVAGVSRSGRSEGNYYQYIIDLSAYAGQTGYIAIRHFNCTDMYFLNIDDVSYGEGGAATVPIVSTSTPSNVSQTTATCGGNVISDGGSAVHVRGVCWSTNPNPTLSDWSTQAGGTTGSFTVEVWGLSVNTTYYVRAYAENDIGVGYGEVKSFTTTSSSGSSLTVFNGTVENETVPIVGWCANQYSKCEYVMPASSLSAMNGSTITKMVCYNSRSNISFGAASYKVFLKEVGFTSISEYQGYSNATVVYEGSLSLNAQGQLVIEFTTPYHYQGGNLLIGVYNYHLGTQVGWCYYYGQEVSGASIVGWSYNNIDESGPAQCNFLPKTTFYYY
ncbi:MAG: choice-of-anchor J domain-containing protein [Bacteroidales bacterium]|nr:choice-of-anchor J domain-containing protein [Bacteroidales bacterium]